MIDDHRNDSLSSPGDRRLHVALAPAIGSHDEPLRAWREAAAAAAAAYDDWRRDRDADSYATYRALADRADAAQERLAARTGRRR